MNSGKRYQWDKKLTTPWSKANNSPLNTTPKNYLKIEQNEFQLKPMETIYGFLSVSFLFLICMCVSIHPVVNVCKLLLCQCHHFVICTSFILYDV